MVQPNVERLKELGPLPSSDDDDDDKFREIEALIMSIVEPISDDDARVLATLFGPDDCFGAAERLMTLIETAPGWPIAEVLPEGINVYIDYLRQAAINSGLLPGTKFAYSKFDLAEGVDGSDPKRAG